MAFGKRIKLFRTLRGMKQRQVGEILGFNGAATEVRMAQYEAEAREPKSALVEQMAQIFKALSDENRIRILKQLRDGEKCGCELLEELKISQPTLSHHMKILCDSGLVTGRKEGKWIHYSINCETACCLREKLANLASPENQPENCSCEK